MLRGFLVTIVLLWSPAVLAQDSTDAEPDVTPEETPSPTPTPVEIEPDEIVVTGARADRKVEDAVVPVTVVDREEIEASGANNLADLLQDVPGVELYEDFRGPAIRLMGLEPEYVLVLVDGERTVGRVNGAMNLSEFNLDDVERVEIVRGASSALWGSDALAGVVNVITRRSTEPLEASVRAQLGTMREGNLVLRAASRRDKYEISGTLGGHTRDPYDLSPEDLQTTGSGFNAANGSLRAHVQTSDAFEVTGRVGYNLHDQDAIDQANGGTFDRLTRTERFTASIRPDYRVPGRSARLHGSLFYQRYRDQFFLDQRGTNLLDSFDLSEHNLIQAQSQFDTVIGGEHLVTAGLEASIERLGADRIVDPPLRRRGAGFGQIELNLIDSLSIAGGVRADVDSQFGGQPTPKAAVRFQPFDQVTLRAQYGWGFRAPDFTVLYLDFTNSPAGYRVLGNDQLNPETSQSVSGGVVWNATRALTVEAQAYRNDVKNQIIAVPIGDDNGTLLFSYENLAQTWTQGIEGSVGARMKMVRIAASYAFLQTLDVEANQPLPGRPGHRATLSASGVLPNIGTQLALRGELTSNRDFFVDIDGDGDIDTLRADPELSLDFQAAHDFTERFQVFAGATNLLGAGDAQLHPIPPRAFYIGAQVRYR